MHALLLYLSMSPSSVMLLDFTTIVFKSGSLLRPARHEHHQGGDNTSTAHLAADTAVSRHMIPIGSCDTYP